MDSTAIDRIKNSFAAQSMMATLGAELSEVSTGLVRISAPILAGTRQQQGFGHAGLTFSIGDSPARGTRLIATGRVIKPGKRLSVVTAEVHAEEDGKQTLVAILQGTMVPVPR